MSDLIRREDAKAAIRQKFADLADRCEINEVLNGLPAVDAVEVKHGRWLECDDGWGDIHYQCSECGQEWNLDAGTPEENNMNHCPNCGAKMDGGEEDATD